MSRVRTFLVLSLILVGLSVVMVPSHASMSQIRGTVYWYDQYQNLRTLPWVQVVATAQDGSITTESSTTDGAYILWVPAGIYNVSVTANPGFFPQAKENVAVSDGGVTAGVDFYLEPTGEPIPEYPAIVQPIIVFVVALSATVMIRRFRRTSQEMMKR